MKRRGNKTTKKEIRFIDLFSGIGGFRIGLERQGFRCVFSSEINDPCNKTYKENFGEIPRGNIKNIKAYEIPKHEILTAGFPCQAFSAAGKKRGFRDTRGTLVFDILRIMEEKKPLVVFLENVKNLKYHYKGHTLNIILKHIKNLGYKVSWDILNAKDFGVPQNRERIIIIGSRNKRFDFSKIKRSQKIPKLKNFLDKCVDKKEYLSPEEYTLINRKKLKQQPTGLIFVGYRNKPIRTKGVRPNTEHLSRVHRQCNRIHSSEGTCPTIASTEISGRYHIYHNEKVRKLTINECFRIMGFPENYKKISPRADLYRQIGNSICIPMVEAIAEQIKEQLL